VQDQARDVLAAPLVLGRLVPGQAGTAGGVAVLEVGRPAGRAPVGDLPPALRAAPGQRRVVALRAGQVPDRVLGGAVQHLRAGLAAVPVERATEVLGGREAAAGGDTVPPAAGCRLPAARAAAVGRTRSWAGSLEFPRK
jgi:hypothetical protein